MSNPLTAPLQMQKMIGRKLDDNYRIIERGDLFPVGKILAQYKLGDVFQGSDAQDRRLLLLKISRNILDFPAARERLSAFVHNAAQIRHESLLRIESPLFHRVMLDNAEQNYILIQQASGVALSEALQNSAQSFPFGQVVPMLAELTKAISEARRYQLQPVIQPDKILFNSNAEQSKLTAVLVDIGFSAIWSATPPTSEEEDVKRLNRLFFSLLRHDVNAFAGEWPAENEIEGALTAREKQDGQWAAQTRFALKKLLGGEYRSLSTYEIQLKSPTLNTQPLPSHPAPRSPSPVVAPVADSSPAPVSRSWISHFPTPSSSPTGASATKSAQLPEDQIEVYAGQEKISTVSLARLRTSLGHPNEEAPLVTVGGNSQEDFINLTGVEPRRLCILYQNGQYGGRYTVTDTREGLSPHVATLDEVPLSPAFAALFQESSTLKVGDYTIRLKRGEAPSTTKGAQVQPLRLEENRFAGEPGTRLVIQAAIANPTSLVDRFWLVVDGAPGEWLVETPEPTQLFTDDPGINVKIFITLPPVQRSAAKLYPLTLRLISVNLVAQVAAVRLWVHLLPNYAFVGQLDPIQMRIGKRGYVAIHNQGNVTRTFRLAWRDRERLLQFQPAEASLTIRAGEVGEVAFRPYLRNWRWVGGKQTHPMTVEVLPEQGTAQTYSGEIASRALIPGWAMPLLMILLGLSTLLYIQLFKPAFTKPAFIKTATANATPNATPNTNATPYADATLVIQSETINGCLYEIYQDDKVVKPMWFALDNQVTYTVTTPVPPDTIFQIRVRNCLGMGEKTSTLKVQARPTETPTPTAVPPTPVLALLTTIENVADSACAPSAPPPLLSEPILLGQTGDICFQWQVANAYESLSIVISSTVKQPALALQEPTGKLCLPIASTFQNAGATGVQLSATYGGTGTVKSELASLQVVAPICTVNTADTIPIREGASYAFPERGRFTAGEALMIKTRPFCPREQAPEQWIQVFVPGDPRPAWIPAAYLYCPGNYHRLPESAPPPPTPTLSPTPTIAPTATPAPTAEPLVSVSPKVIAQGDSAKVKWKIENVKEVYLNDEGVNGVSERQVTPEIAGKHVFKWRVINLDGSSYELERTLIVIPNTSAATPAPPR